ncbi:MAG UNVERIFIED_CONTAM: hypothetical protein LVQ98_07100 [Rickettsiaceae bacterium]
MAANTPMIKHIIVNNGLRSKNLSKKTPKNKPTKMHASKSVAMLSGLGGLLLVILFHF